MSPFILGIIGAYRPSTYGKSYTTRTLPFTDQYTNAAYGSSQGFLIGAARTSSTTYYTSSNGITWTSRTAPTGVEYAVVGTASNGSGYIRAYTGNSHYSADGVNWSYCNPPTSSYANTIFSVNGYWVFWDDNGGNIMYGTTGTSGWTTSAPTIGNFTGQSNLVYGNGKYVFARNNAGSSNLSVWATTGLSTAATSSSPAGNSAVAFGKGIFVTGTGAYNNTYSTSTDAVSWTSRTMPNWVGTPNGAPLKPVFYDTTFVSHPSFGPGYGNSAYSNDGITWTVISSINSALDDYVWAGGNGTILIIPRGASGSTYYTTIKQ